jgi:opacity protein-like surface antigen
MRSNNPRPGRARALLLLVLLLGAASAARAEWYADLYGGSAYSQHSDFTLLIRPPGLQADHTFHDVKWDSSTTAGARAGYWLESVPWYGFGLDLFRFDANVPDQTVNSTILGVTSPTALGAIDVSVTAISLDVLRLRYSFMRSDAYPKGRLQPYFTAGPAQFRTTATNKNNSELTKQSAASDTTWGYKVGAGASWQIANAIGIFGELRYTHVHTEPVLQSAFSPLRVPMTFDLNTRHLIAGVSLRF